MTGRLKIEHRICCNNLGEDSDADAQQYVIALTAALQQEFPDAEIRVNLDSDFANESQTFVGGREPDGINVHEVVHEIANRVWER
jgi:hypothetical protein